MFSDLFDLFLSWLLYSPPCETNMPPAATPQTVAELIGLVDSDATTVASDSAVITKLNSDYAAVSATAAQTLAADQATLATDTASRNAAIGLSGGVFIVNPDGTATAYEPDGAGGVKITVLKPASIAVPAPTVHPVVPATV